MLGEPGILIGSWSRNALETSGTFGRASHATIDHWALDRGEGPPAD